MSTDTKPERMQAEPIIGEPNKSNRSQTGRLSWFVPGLILLVAALLWILTYQVPDEYLDRGLMAGARILILLVTGCCLIFWAFSVFRFVHVFIALLTVFGLSFAVAKFTIREVHFTGDMEPIFHFTWEPRVQDLLKADEKNRSAAQLDPESVATEQLVIDLSRDCPDYRGPQRDGKTTTILDPDWQAHPPQLLWKQRLGGGYAGFVVVGPFLVTIEQRDQLEAVVAYHRDTGAKLWQYDYPAQFQEAMGGPGPRATPTIAEGVVYSLGALGDLVCLDLQTGKERWRTNILEDAAAKNLEWAMAGAPLVWQDLVIVNPGGTKPESGLVAYDRTTGKRVWGGGNSSAGYSSPQLATIAEQQQILLFDGQGLAGYQPQTGKELWRFTWTTNQGINVAQPLVFAPNQVYISSGYTKGGALLEINPPIGSGNWTVTELWQNRHLKCKFTSPVAKDGALYGLNDGVLACIALKDGARLWQDRKGQYGHGQLLLSGQTLIILSEKGELALVAADPKKFRELARLAVFPEDEKTWNIPTLAGDQLFVRNHRQMACYRVALLSDTVVESPTQTEPDTATTSTSPAP